MTGIASTMAGSDVAGDPAAASGSNEPGGSQAAIDLPATPGRDAGGAPVAISEVTATGTALAVDAHTAGAAEASTLAASAALAVSGDGNQEAVAPRPTTAPGTATDAAPPDRLAQDSASGSGAGGPVTASRLAEPADARELAGQAQGELAPSAAESVSTGAPDVDAVRFTASVLSLADLVTDGSGDTAALGLDGALAAPTPAPGSPGADGQADAFLALGGQGLAAASIRAVLEGLDPVAGSG